MGIDDGHGTHSRIQHSARPLRAIHLRSNRRLKAVASLKFLYQDSQVIFDRLLTHPDRNCNFRICLVPHQQADDLPFANAENDGCRGFAPHHDVSKARDNPAVKCLCYVSFTRLNRADCLDQLGRIASFQYITARTRIQRPYCSVDACRSRVSDKFGRGRNRNGIRNCRADYLRRE